MSGWPSVTKHDCKPIKKQASINIRITEFEDGTLVIYPTADKELVIEDVLKGFAAYIRMCADDVTYASTIRGRTVLYHYLDYLNDYAANRYPMQDDIADEN